MKQRLQGYHQALADHKISFCPDYLKTADRASSGYQAVNDLLALPNPPTAIHCCNDHIAVGAYQALHNQNIHIPEQISLTGFDAIPNTLLMEPQLTTVSQPLHQMGATAAEMLIAQINSGEEPSTVSSPILFPTEILLRGSTAPPNSSL